MQKKLLLVLAIVASALVSRAQVEKGNWLLGGSFSFGTNSNTNTGGTATGSNSNLNPELGWAVAKNSVIGFRGGFSTSTSKDNTANKQTSTNYSAGLFWKKFFPINEKVGWYGDLSSGYTHGQNKYVYSAATTQKYSASGFYASISPGVYYKPSKKVFLNAGFGGLSYNHAKSDAGSLSGNTKTSTFNLNLLNYFAFGVSFVISKEHQM